MFCCLFPPSPKHVFEIVNLSVAFGRLHHTFVVLFFPSDEYRFENLLLKIPDILKKNFIKNKNANKKVKQNAIFKENVCI
jgi:hypothetical protein